MNRKKLSDKSLELLKNRSLWMKFAGVLSTLIFLTNAYYDLQERIQKTSQETEKELIGKGQLSEQLTIEAMVELQTKLQFVYERGTLVQDRVEDLELENKRLYARLERFRSITGIPFEEEDLKDLAARLIPFLEKDDGELGFEVGGGGVGMGMGGGGAGGNYGSQKSSLNFEEDPNEGETVIEDIEDIDSSADFLLDIVEPTVPEASPKTKKPKDRPLLDSKGDLQFKDLKKAW